MAETNLADASPRLDDMDYQTYHGTAGSWTPTLVLLACLAARRLWRNSVQFQRFLNNQRIRWRTRFGFRDESKYQMGAGDGSNMKVKRQG